MLRLINEVHERQRELGRNPSLLIGLQKQGEVAHFLALIGRHLTPDTVLPVSDDYRGHYIKRQTRPPTSGIRRTTARTSSSTRRDATHL